MNDLKKMLKLGQKTNKIINLLKKVIILISVERSNTKDEYLFLAFRLCSNTN